MVGGRGGVWIMASLGGEEHCDWDVVSTDPMECCKQRLDHTRGVATRESSSRSARNLVAIAVEGSGRFSIASGTRCA